MVPKHLCVAIISDYFPFISPLYTYFSNYMGKHYQCYFIKVTGYNTYQFFFKVGNESDKVEDHSFIEIVSGKHLGIITFITTQEWHVHTAARMLFSNHKFSHVLKNIQQLPAAFRIK